MGMKKLTIAVLLTAMLTGNLNAQNFSLVKDINTNIEPLGGDPAFCKSITIYTIDMQNLPAGMYHIEIKSGTT